MSTWRDEIVNQFYSTSPGRNVEKEKEMDAVKTTTQPTQPNRAQAERPAARKCPVKHHALNPPTTTDTSLAVKPPLTASTRPTPPIADSSTLVDEMERDFTTQGKPSDLSCPFASTSKTGYLGPDNLVDPIAAEFHSDRFSAQSANPSQTCGRCPIRFIDKHSPEEVAQYFEKHKHEIPRSHEICVKRYQQNDMQIRELDQKYGNLVSMIQGLGNKHKAYLPDNALRGPGSNGFDPENHGAVEKWANNIDEETNGQDGEIPTPTDERGEERLSHFDKPLRDIRVGESPSRPWGIAMPVQKNRVASSTSVSSISNLPAEKVRTTVEQDRDSGLAATAKSKTGSKLAIPASRSSASTHQSRKSRAAKRITHITFNGPVFIGYPPDQAAEFLKQLGANQVSSARAEGVAFS